MSRLLKQSVGAGGTIWTAGPMLWWERWCLSHVQVSFTLQVSDVFGVCFASEVIHSWQQNIDSGNKVSWELCGLFTSAKKVTFLAACCNLCISLCRESVPELYGERLDWALPSARGSMRVWLQPKPSSGGEPLPPTRPSQLTVCLGSTHEFLIRRTEIHVISRQESYSCHLVICRFSPNDTILSDDTKQKNLFWRMNNNSREKKRVDASNLEDPWHTQILSHYLKSHPVWTTPQTGAAVKNQAGRSDFPPLCPSLDRSGIKE